MPLTRHLYEIDEVVSALQICLCKGWTRGLFWLWELVVSQEEALASETLTNLWLHWGGGQDPQLLALPSDRWIERYNRIQNAITKAGTLNAVRFLTATAAMPVRPSVTPLPKDSRTETRRTQRAAAFVASLDPAEEADPTEAANFWISFDSACRQGCRTDAFWFLQTAPLSADAIWSALTLAARGGAITKAAIALLKAKADPVQQTLYQGAAVLFLCRSTTEREAPTDSLSLKYDEHRWAEWDTVVGRRKARVHAIPKDALTAHTTRGAMEFKYTNIGDVREPVALLSEGCKFWQEALRSHGIKVDEETDAITFPDDDVLELFYDRYFPDDIPDEWSKEDQEKSHGRGCKESAEPLPLPQFREEPIDQRAWTCAIHVRGKKR